MARIAGWPCLDTDATVRLSNVQNANPLLIQTEQYGGYGVYGSMLVYDLDSGTVYR